MQQPKFDVIVAVGDLSDPAVRAASAVLSTQSANSRVFTMSALPTEVPDGDIDLYLVGHANGQSFEDFRNPADLYSTYAGGNPDLRTWVRASATVVLVACEAASEASAVEEGSGGFQAATFAVNFSRLEADRTVQAAVGTLVPTQDHLTVCVNGPSAELTGSDRGWVQFSGGRQLTIRQQPELMERVVSDTKILVTQGDIDMLSEAYDEELSESESWDAAEYEEGDNGD